VLNENDPTCVTMAARRKAQVFWFSRQKEVKRGAWVREGRSYSAMRGRRRAAPFAQDSSANGRPSCWFQRDSAERRAQPGECAGGGVRGHTDGMRAGKIRQAVRDFKAVEHRLEFVATIRGVDYYNDSKATNVDATIKALESFPANIHLILGGKDKGSDYSVLNDLLRQRVKRVYTIGAAAAKIESQIVSSSGVVLLAPACASFDQFKNYEHRGRCSRRLLGRWGEGRFHHRE
jgi:UDP-N-acetylmuramoylalanine--D-glutamate ligase